MVKVMFWLTVTLSLSVFAQVDLDRFMLVSDGFYRGARPTKPEHLAQLNRIGIKTIVNVDDDVPFIKKEALLAAPFGIKQFSSPMSGWNRPDDAQINQILNVLSDPRNQPVYLHCQYGRDRTGLITALYRVLIENWQPQDAYDEMISMGFRANLVNLKTYFWDKSKSKNYSGPVIRSP